MRYVCAALFFVIMCPSFRILGIVIPSYGAMAALGGLAGISYIYWRCQKFGLKRDDGVYIFVMGIVGALIGAKVFYLLTVLPELIADLPLLKSNFPVFVEKYVSGGLVFYGGLIGGVITAFWCAKAYRVRLRDCYPVLLPATAVLAGFGRIGCFLTGCCYGKETDSIFAVTFHCSAYAPNGIPLIPTQLIEAGFDFILFFLLILLMKNKTFRLFSLDIYLGAYALFRFFLEFLRGDLARGVWLGLSTSQWISIAVIIAVLGKTLLFRNREIREKTDDFKLK